MFHRSFSHVLFRRAVGCIALIPLLYAYPFAGDAFAGTPDQNPNETTSKKHSPNGKKFRGATAFAVSEGQVTTYCADIGVNSGGSTFSSTYISAPKNSESAEILVSLPAVRNYDVTVLANIGNRSVITFMDNTQSGVLTIKAGDLQSDNRLQVKGLEIGETQISYTAVNVPAGDPVPTWNSTNVVVWDLEAIVDYDGRGNPSRACYDSTMSPQLGNQKSTCGYKVGAIAADGVSRLLFRIKAPRQGQGCIEVIDDGDGNNDGYPTPGITMNPASVGNPYTGATYNTADRLDTEQIGSDHWVFATYLAPDEFDLAEEEVRKVKIGVAYNPVQSNGTSYIQPATTTLEREITVRRPPVFLIHGLFDSRELWEQKFLPWLGDPSFVYSFDYKSTNVSPLSRNATRLKGKIAEFLYDLRNVESLAVTRVDVVAHSMGGLIARTAVADSGYRRSDNLQGGDINKIAFLASPIEGTKFANALINLHEYMTDANGNHSDDRINWIERRLYENDPARIHNGAICDLSENNPKVSFNSVADVKGRVYTATGGSTTDFTAPMNWLRIYFLDFIADEEETHLDPYILTEPNDGIVPLSSANGGYLDSQFRHNYPTLLHSNFYEPNDKGIAAQVDVSLQIQNDLYDATLWSPLPAIISAGNAIPGINGRGAVDQSNFVNQCNTMIGQPMYLDSDPTAP